ncbi:hypothetical protein J6590_043825 [Homalodisca vitripennis]|nr:hypothetical protein J6590_043825 [Homalodisca vitripennis]
MPCRAGKEVIGEGTLVCQTCPYCPRLHRFIIHFHLHCALPRATRIGLTDLKLGTSLEVPLGSRKTSTDFGVKRSKSKYRFVHLSACLSVYPLLVLMTCILCSDNAWVRYVLCGLQAGFIRHPAVAMMSWTLSTHRVTRAIETSLFLEKRYVITGITGKRVSDIRDRLQLVTLSRLIRRRSMKLWPIKNDKGRRRTFYVSVD